MKNKTSMSDKKYRKLGDCTCFNIRKASRLITQLYDQALKPTGIKITQFTLLAALANSEETTINELSGMLGMDRTTLTRGLDRLEKEKLVASRDGIDARERYVRLTERGFTVLDSAIPKWQAAQSSMVAGFGDNFPEFLEVLKKSIFIANRHL